MIRKITPNGDVSTVAGVQVAGFADGSTGVAKFCHPTGIAVHPSTGDIFIADQLNYRIRKVSTSEGTVTTVAGSGVGGSADGEWDVATFNRPYDVKVNERDDSLIVADSCGNRVRKVSQDGIVSTVAWSRYPAGLTIDQGRNICYISTDNKIVLSYLP